MITTVGKDQIIKAVTGASGQFANYMVLGVGNVSESLSDKSLAFEILRIPVDSIAPDLENQQMVIMGTFLPGVINTVYECGIVSSEDLSDNSKVLPLPGTDSSLWTNSVFATTNARASAQNLKVDFIASGTTLAENSSMNLDLSTFAPVDFVRVGFYATSNISNVKLRLGLDNANYYEFTIGAPAAGYNINSMQISSATVVGNPSWDSILYSAISVTGTSGGSGSVYLDVVKFEQALTTATDILVARTVLGTPYVTNQNIVNNFEYRLDVNIS